MGVYNPPRAMLKDNEQHTVDGEDLVAGSVRTSSLLPLCCLLSPESVGAGDPRLLPAVEGWVYIHPAQLSIKLTYTTGRGPRYLGLFTLSDHACLRK